MVFALEQTANENDHYKTSRARQNRLRNYVNTNLKFIILDVLIDKGPPWLNYD